MEPLNACVDIIDAPHGIRRNCTVVVANMTSKPVAASGTLITVDRCRGAVVDNMELRAKDGLADADDSSKIALWRTSRLTID